MGWKHKPQAIYVWKYLLKYVVPRAENYKFELSGIVAV